MTQHALQRLAERFSKYDAEHLLQEIEKAVLSGDARYVAETVMLGETVYSYQLQDGTFAFPVIAEGEDDFSVITVLSEGMEVSTSTGNITLKAEYLDPGLHTEISETRYHGDLLSRRPSLSSTLARKLTTQSPLHAWTAHPRLNPDHEPVQKRSFDVGRAAHSVVLGRGAPFEAYPPKLLASNGAASTKAAKEWAEAKRADGVTPLKQDDFDAVHAMATALETKLAELGVRFDADRSEIVALTEIDDVMCRAMLDNAPAEPSAPIYDFKTCESAAPDACMRAVMNYGYDVQAAHYLETWAAVTGEERVLRFVFQEKSAPFEVCVVQIGSFDLDFARKKIARAREIWGLCLSQGAWPGYPREVVQPDLPEFYHMKFQERYAAEEAFKASVGRDVYALSYEMQRPA